MTEAASERPTTSDFDGGVREALRRNREFSSSGRHAGVRPVPALGVLVIGCLDPRVDPAHVLGLELGDAMVIRNSGGRVTDEVIEDVALVGELAERMVPEGPLMEVVVIHHTECGARMLADDEFRSRLADRVGSSESELRDRAVVDTRETVAADVERLRASSALSPRLSFSGHVYDVATGLITTVAGRAPSIAAGGAL